MTVRLCPYFYFFVKKKKNGKVPTRFYRVKKLDFGPKKKNVSRNSRYLYPTFYIPSLCICVTIFFFSRLVDILLDEVFLPSFFYLETGFF